MRYERFSAVVIARGCSAAALSRQPGRRGQDCRGGAAADRIEVAALRRTAAGARRQGQGRRQAMAVHAARIARAEQGRCSGSSRPPRSRVWRCSIVNHPDRASDQWMWTPALQRERRIALQDRSTRFFGTDFSFEDLEERDVNQYNYRLLGEETIDGAACWRIESTPSQKKISQYTKSERLDQEGHLRARAGRELHQDRRGSPAEVQRFRAGAGASGPGGGSRCPTCGARAARSSRSRSSSTTCRSKDEDFTLQALRNPL